MFEDSNKPTILVANDDGIHAPGLALLAEELKVYGNVLVVAPDQQQSSSGHSVTLHKPLRLDEVKIEDGVAWYQCSGTPVDGVKIGVNQFLKGKPDYCFSGVNHGNNSSINVLYSGTMSAAIEAYMEGVNSAGISFQRSDISKGIENIKRTIHETFSILKQQKENGHTICLNVNVPEVSESDFKGLKVARQANSRWKEEFQVGNDPRGKGYYWLTGTFLTPDMKEDADEWALSQGYASAVPVQVDMTDYDTLNRLKD